MLLSGIYGNLVMYGLVYHTREDSSTVEFINERFFSSKKEAWAWFNDQFSLDHFIQPEVVEVSGFDRLSIRKTHKTFQKANQVKVDSTVKYYASNRVGRVICNSLKDGDEAIAVEWDNGELAKVNVNDIVFMEP